MAKFQLSTPLERSSVRSLFANPKLGVNLLFDLFSRLLYRLTRFLSPVLRRVPNLFRSITHFVSPFSAPSLPPCSPLSRRRLLFSRLHFWPHPRFSQGPI